MRKTKIKKSIVAFVAFCFLMLHSSALSMAASVVEAYALDTIAGQATVLRTSKAASNAELIFVIGQPGGKLIEVAATSNANGVAIAELSDYYTKYAGDYSVGVRYKDSAILGNLNEFEVFASKVSLSNSRIDPVDQVVKTSAVAELNVFLGDEYGNPVADHFLNLVSSDGSQSYTAMSDKLGAARFQVMSSVPGLKQYVVNDLTSNVALGSEARVLFVDSSFNIFEDSYSSLASMGSGSGSVDSFMFEDVPNTLNPGEQYSLTVTAIDVNEDEVTNYEGTIGFVVTSDNASFAETPTTHEFTVQDQGSHVFSLAFRFLEVGSYTIKVADLENTSISSELTLLVTEPSDAPSTSDSSVLKITNPSAGTVSSNTVVISGEAEPASHIKIYDNDVEINETTVGVSGQFTFTTSLLNDGSHIFHVSKLNEVGTIVETSDAITVVVDTQGAEISSVIIDPDETLDPGEAFKVKLYVTDTLSKAQMLLNGNVYDMDFNLGGYYELDASAPIEFGDYDIDFILLDELSNQAKFEKEASISVGQAPAPVVADVAVPGNVGELVATPGDGQVVLEWATPSEGDNPTIKYRVFYGTQATQLSEAVDTFTDSTTWYIPDLVNGQLYYFGVLAIDGVGNYSANFGHIAAATPTAKVVVEEVDLEVENGSAGEEAIAEMEKDASDSGPEITWLVLLSIIAGFFSMRRKGKKV